jgi:hypothetical protein
MRELAKIWFEQVSPAMMLSRARPRLLARSPSTYAVLTRHLHCRKVGQIEVFVYGHITASCADVDLNLEADCARPSLWQ